MLENLNIEPRLAKRLNELSLELDIELNQLLRDVRAQLPDAEFTSLRRSVGDVIGILYTDVMRDLYKKFPELKPAGMP